MATSFLSYFLVGFLVLACELNLAQRNSGDEFEILDMEKEELLGLFDVFDALLGDSDWAKDHPQPCSETPWPGVECEIGQEETPLFHVTKIHIGPDILNPPCKNSATFSNSLLKLPYLKTLSIFNCFLTSQLSLSPSLFGSLSSLEHLALDSNPAITGEIPKSLANLASLRVLSLSQSSLNGEIPKEIGEIVMLEQLDLSYNNLSGAVPEAIGGMEKLTILDLSWNSLEGQLPSSLGQLHFLQKIDLSSNKIMGKIPPQLGKLESLVLLDLSNNLLSGQIPETILDLDHLEYFILDHNPLNTELPNFLGHLKKLQTMSLSSCGLVGKLPTSFSFLQHLSSLSLDNNSLTGTIPPSLGTLQNLDLLNLSHNLLSGEVLLSEDFVKRLGMRLDIRGNSGLCTRNVHQKNISVCLNNASGEAEPPRSGETLAWKKPDYESDRTEPSDKNRIKESSAGGGVSLLKPNLLIILCLLYFYSIFFSMSCM